MASLHFVPFEKEMIEFIVVCSAMQPVKKSAVAAMTTSAIAVTVNCSFEEKKSTNEFFQGL